MMGCICFSPSFLILSSSGTAITVLSRTSGVKGFLVGSLCGIGVVVAAGPLAWSGGVLRFDLRVAIKILGCDNCIVGRTRIKRGYAYSGAYLVSVKSFLHLLSENETGAKLCQAQIHGFSLTPLRSLHISSTAKADPLIGKEIGFEDR